METVVEYGSFYNGLICVLVYFDTKLLFFVFKVLIVMIFNNWTG